MSVLEKIKKLENIAYQIKNDNVIKYAEVLQEELQKEFNSNITVEAQPFGDMEVDIFISDIHICNLELDSCGKEIWINKIN